MRNWIALSCILHAITLPVDATATEIDSHSVPLQELRSPNAAALTLQTDWFYEEGRTTTIPSDTTEVDQTVGLILQSSAQASVFSSLRLRVGLRASYHLRNIEEEQDDSSYTDHRWADLRPLTSITLAAAGLDWVAGVQGTYLPPPYRRRVVPQGTFHWTYAPASGLAPFTGIFKGGTFGRGGLVVQQATSTKRSQAVRDLDGAETTTEETLATPLRMALLASSDWRGWEIEGELTIFQTSSSSPQGSDGKDLWADHFQVLAAVHAPLTSAWLVGTTYGHKTSAAAHQGAMSLQTLSSTLIRVTLEGARSQGTRPWIGVDGLFGSGGQSFDEFNATLSLRRWGLTAGGGWEF